VFAVVLDQASAEQLSEIRPTLAEFEVSRTRKVAKTAGNRQRKGLSDMANDDSDMNEGTEQDGSSNALLSALKSKEVLIPAAISAAGAVAATAGPSLFKRAKESTENLGEEQAEKLGRRALDGARSGMKSKGGLGGIAGKALSKATGGGGGGDDDDGGGEGGGKKTRRLPIQRWTDVAVPVETAYEAWVKFDQYPQFMHRVLNVEQKGNDKVRWQEKIWFSTRDWEGEITDRRKNDRIAWKTTNGMSHKGIVSFHKIGDNLTRVMVDMEFEPTGMIEKMASGLRFVKRAVQSDLARFKAYVELEDAKGIEYRPVKEDDDDESDRRSNGRRSGDDSSREQERNERQSRRDERRESVGAS
jgi:Polyketide cyclase / dehydrase and lipid transport